MFDLLYTVYMFTYFNILVRIGEETGLSIYLFDDDNNKFRSPLWT